VVGLNLMIGYAGSSFIDNVGHVGGLLGGAALMLLVGPRYRCARLRALLRQQPAAAAV
jgi:membrane associated rhomboid family serine protease